MKRTIRNILDHLAQEALIANHEGKVIWLNRYAASQQESAAWIEKLLSECFAAQAGEPKTTVCTPCGDLYSLEINPCDEGTICILENLTSFQNPKIQLKCYKEIVDKLDVFGTDTTGKFVIASKWAASYYGTSQKELLHRHLMDFYNYASDDQKEHQNVIESGISIVNRYTNRASTGQNFVYRPLLYSTYPFSYHGKNILAYTIMNDDKKAETLLQEVTELRRRMHVRDLQDEKNKNKNNTSYSFLNVVGISKSIQKNIQEAQLMANLDQNILIIGETGTGKEIFAQGIHNFSNRKKEPFIPINCAAIPENLFESMLFGATKGAYTGAVESEGLFQVARHGTIFLDELNSMPVQMQTKLLRILQERKAMRVGGGTLYPIYCRVISAINEDPHRLIQNGRLRSDLFYRIAPLTLHIAPLRERKEDIPELCEHFIQKYNKMMYKAVQGLSQEVKSMMLSYPWPGNVRELEYVVENMMIRSQTSLLQFDDLPQHLKEQLALMDDSTPCHTNEQEQTDNLEGPNTKWPVIPQLEEALGKYEKELIFSALEHEGGNRKRAAERLGISRQNLYYRMKRIEKQKNIT